MGECDMLEYRAGTEPIGAYSYRFVRDRYIQGVYIGKNGILYDYIIEKKQLYEKCEREEKKNTNSKNNENIKSSGDMARTRLKIKALEFLLSNRDIVRVMNKYPNLDKNSFMKYYIVEAEEYPF